MRQLIILLLVIGFSAFGLEDTDFDQSNGWDIMQRYSIKFDEPIESSNLKLKLLRENYQRLRPSKMLSNPTSIIPKVIHQIWLGDNPLPKNYQYYRETWKKYHPNWEIKLWSEADLIKEGFASMDLYWLAESYQERADIMRYEILQRYGGLYIDTDIECLASYDELHHKYDFYAGMESPVVNKFVVSIPNSLIASVPNHPILANTLFKIRAHWTKAEEKFEQQYSLSRHVYFRSRHFLAVQRTMYPFDDAVYSFLQQADQADYRTVILPSGYNTPIFFVDNNPWNNFLRKITFRTAKFTSEVIIRPETMSFQHYGKERSAFAGKSSFDNKLYSLNFFDKWRLTKFKERDKYYLSFKDLFNKAFPLDVISYEPLPQVPEIIYLDDNSSLSLEELTHLKHKWQEDNRFFSIKIIDDELLKDYLPVNFKNIPDKIAKQIAVLYLLNSQGGIYVTSKIKPVDLHELNYKYSYYGKFVKPVSIEESLKIDANLIAVKSHHSIIVNLLREIEQHINKYGSIAEAEVNNLYMQNIYKYNQLDGRNIVFPESVFTTKINKWIIK